MLRMTALWILLLCIHHLAMSDEKNNPSTIPLSKKFYLNADQIHLIDNKICIQIEGYVYETPAIRSDEIGYYIDTVAQSGYCAWYEWQCRDSKCQFCNLRGIDWECRKCHRPISE